MSSRFVVLAASAVLIAAVAGQASAACEFAQLAEVPVTMVGLQPTIKVKVNGQDATFIVDSGAFFSTVSTEAAAKFGMKRTMTPFGMHVRGVGGSERDAKAVRALEFTFAGAPFKNVDFLVADRIGMDGLLGENVLGTIEVEYDLANGFIRFFKAKGCASDANLAYWSQGKALSRIVLSNPAPYLTQVVSTANVDGHAIKVVFDSGSPLSVLSRPAAARAGVRPSSEGVVAGGVTYGLYGGGMETSIAPFESFAIGDEEIKHTRLRVADIELRDGDMLLGADFFLSHRILVSNSQHKLYFTYNGGPVFKLDRPPGRQVAQAGPARAVTAAPDAAAVAAAPAVGEPKTAEDFSRRGAAWVARRDFPAAIADFSKAIELEPKAARHYHDRAMARLNNHQPVLAMADLDQTLALKPDDVDVLVVRGELYLSRKDVTGAQADFDTALKLAPPNGELPLTLASAYARARMFDQALKMYDGWIAAHPRDERLASALNGRCWTRALAGKGLETALADCDAAMKQGLRVSNVMDSRGLVLLRMGRIDEAISQYDRAIQAQPKNAWSLYGRGLAKLKKGQKAAGDADVQAAISLQPNMANVAKSYGVAPEASAAGEATKAAG
jgi:tetratricopeptide (TPR) repeat protein/predicted aspartyl protease